MKPPQPHHHQPDPTAYLKSLCEQTGWIDIRGRFPIEDLYIPLHFGAMELEETLSHRRLLIVGGPGSGKTTFLRHIAHLWCRGLLDAPSHASLLLPILLGTARLFDHAGTLPQFLAAQSEELNWGLDEAFFSDKLRGGGCIILLDSPDGPPNQLECDTAVRLLEAAIDAYADCRFVVCTRPPAFTSLPGFHTVEIAPLER